MKEDIRFFFQQCPFLRITITFILGIILADTLFNDTHIIVVGLCLVGVLVVLLLREKMFSKQIGYHRINDIGVYFFVGLVGMYCHLAQHQKQNIPLSFKPDTQIIVALNDNPTVPDSYFRAVVKARYIKAGEDNLTEYDFNIQTTFDYQCFAQHLNTQHYSYILKINKAPQRITQNTNIGAFDFQRYYERKHIYFKMFVHKDECVIIDSVEHPLWTKMLNDTRAYFIQAVQKNISEKSVYGFVEALLIGYKDDLDKDLYQEYINSGTVHIIAISGLHIGFIYWLMSFVVLKRVKQKYPIFTRIMIFLTLWFYTFLAGGTPSILRASIMFSVLLFAEHKNKQGSVFNTLSLAALLIVFLNTNALFDLGFILSFTAILSLITFFPILKKWYAHYPLWVQWVMDSISSSIAAQILVLPVTSIVFKTFSTYFIINNLIAVPASTAILALSLGLIICSPLAPLAQFIGALIKYLVMGLDTYIRFANDWSFAQIHLPHFNVIVVVLYYGLIVSLLVIPYLKQKALVYILLFLMGISITVGVLQYRTQQQLKIIFYGHGRQLLIDLVEGEQSHILSYDSLSDNAQQYTIKPCHTHLGVTQSSTTLIKPFHIYEWHHKTILVLDTMRFYNVSKIPQERPQIKVDYLVVRRTNLYQLKDIEKMIDYKQLILEPQITEQKWRSVVRADFETEKVHLLHDQSFIVCFDESYTTNNSK